MFRTHSESGWFIPQHFWLFCLQAIALLSGSRVYALKGDSGCGYRTLCVNATVENDVVTYELTTMDEQPVGWMALGFGTRMVGSHIVVLWRNEDGSTSLSQRYAIGYREPYVLKDPPRIAHAVDPKAKSWQPPKSRTYAFQIPANVTQLASESPAERLIWAYSLSLPEEESSSHIGMHYRVGHLHFDLTKDLPIGGLPYSSSPSTPKTAYATHEKLVILHGLLLTVGFLVLIPFGSLVARWGRTVAPAWFKIHWVSNMMLASPVISLGWLLGPLAVAQHSSPHFNDSHQIFGFSFLFMYYGQVLLGRYIHMRRARQITPITRFHPPLNLFHVFLGGSITAAAFFQVRSGLDKWQSEAVAPGLASWCHKALSAWAAIVIFAYLAGLILIPRQLYQERSGELSGDSAYIPLSESAQSPSTRLLFEADTDTEAIGGSRQRRSVESER